MFLSVHLGVGLEDHKKTAPSLSSEEKYTLQHPSKLMFMFAIPGKYNDTLIDKNYIRPDLLSSLLWVTFIGEIIGHDQGE